ncbi:hypothetical protein DV736_g4855, partial [Chaetothyriales sp. CBS 134916]
MSLLRAAILIVSDTVSADPSTDKTAPLLIGTFAELGAKIWATPAVEIVPDSLDKIQRAIKSQTDGYGNEAPPVNLILTTGGTGFATSDWTPEAVKPLLHREAPGLVHAMLKASSDVTPFAMMSRPVAGVRHKSLILTLPGSPKGAKENLEAVIRLLPHAYIPQSNDPHLGATARARSSPYPMLSVADAVRKIWEQCPSPVPETRDMSPDLVGRVIAEDIKAAEAVPAYRATSIPPPLKAGEIARITTGAPLPEGANAVVMVEDTVISSTTDDGKEEKEVEILTDELEVGENVREPGSDVKLGETILKRGMRITSIGGEIGVLAAAGIKRVPVYRQPRVGVLSTGDELVDISYDGPLKRGMIRDSNRPSLLSLIRGWRLCDEVVDLQVARDTPSGQLEEKLRDGFRNHDLDVIVTTGGVSMGELDLLKPTIERSMGGTVHFGRVSMKPGKPTTFASVPFKDTSSGRRGDRLIFGLPGNPASAIVTANLFVLPCLQRINGLEGLGLEKVVVWTTSKIKCNPARVEYHRVVVGVDEKDGTLIARSTGMQRSSRVGSLTSANGLLILPLKQGDWRTLTAVETGSRNHEVVPTQLIAQLAKASQGDVQRSISLLAKANLIAKVKNAKYDGYRLTYGGLDYLALHSLQKANAVYSVGNQIGVGKESDIYVVSDEKGVQRVLKIHRLGRVSFKKGVRNKRDYARTRAQKERGAGSWMYMSRLAAVKEHAFMTALHEAGVSVPMPLGQNRHQIVMSLVDGLPLRQIDQVPDPAALYAELIDMIVTLAHMGLIHGDFNEFNVMIKEEAQPEGSGDDVQLVPVLIDFPQMVSVDHANAEMYFDRDVACVKRFFERRFGFVAESQGPSFHEVKKGIGQDSTRKRLDGQVEASGFSKKMAKELDAYMAEHGVDGDATLLKRPRAIPLWDEA